MLAELAHHEMADVLSRRSVSEGSSFAAGLSFDSRWNRVAVFGFLSVTVPLTIAGGVFTARFVEERHINASVWAFLTGGIALCLTSLFVLHLIRKLETWHDKTTLEGIKIFGSGMAVISGVSFGVYIILGFLRRQDLSTEDENYFAAALFSGLCLGCNLLTYFAAQWYQNIMTPYARTMPLLSLNEMSNNRC